MPRKICRNFDKVAEQAVVEPRLNSSTLPTSAKVSKHRRSAIDVTRQIDLGNVTCLQLPGWGKLLLR